MASEAAVEVKLLFFAKSRELCGCKEDHITVQSPTSFRNLLNTLTNKYNSLSTISGNLILALNQEYLERDSENINLNAGDEIAVIPPISGTTRDNFEGKKVTRLEYECYAPMAEQEMLKICRQIRNKWDVENIVILHRIGEVPVCEGSVIVAVSAPHRKESLEAVHYAIDTLKAQVPVWKKEFYEDETYSWKENCECSWKK